MSASAFTALFGDELLSKSGTVKTAEALQGKKFVMIYFSAHWCPPCRGFTPQLAAKYQAAAAANDIEVVFVSSDRDEEGFDGYYSEMPWLALPYAGRDQKASLGQKYDVGGIPALVVLDASGNLVTKEGRAQVDQYFMGGAAASAATQAAFADLLGEELVTKSGKVKTEEALGGKKFVMIYFSAHWCPPCRGFTPQLAAKYKASAEANEIEVVFVSSDQDEESFKGYYSEMPWVALPFSDRGRSTSLGKKFGVEGIPSLVVLDASGNLVTTEGRAEADRYFERGGAAGSCCTIS